MKKCLHSDCFWDDDKLICEKCHALVGVECPKCFGRGDLPENEAESDWINFGDGLVICAECDGEGYVSDPSFQ